MKTKTSIITLIAIAGISMPASAATLLSFLLPHHDVEVVTNSDVYVQGFPSANPQNPVPYMAVATGFHDFGGSIAGDTQPTQKDVLAAVTKTLDKRGYHLATNKTAPKMIIVYGWGTMNATKLMTDPRFPPVVMNRYQILRFLGGGKMGIPMDANTAFPELGGQLPVGLSLENPRTTDFFQMGEDDYYVIVLTAYDIDAANKLKAKPLWSTKISCSSLGHSMAEVLPTMLSIAAPHIGENMTKPLIVNANDHYKPTIDVGTPTVIENDVK